MAAIEGSVTIGGFIAPSDTTDTYASHVDIYGRGGMRSVADNTERDAITSDRRSEGMFVYVLDPAGDGSVDATLYTLSGGITNSDWIEVELGGGGGYWEQVNASTSIYFVPASGAGYVGIGTTSPVHRLDLKTNPAIGFYHSDGTYQGLIGDGPATVSGGGTYDIGFRANSGYNLLFAAGGSTERMRINSVGRVGIGTTSPSKKLHVSGGDAIIQNDTLTNTFFDVKGTSANAYIRAYSDSNSVWLYQGGNSSYLQAQSGSTMRVGSGTGSLVFSDTSGEVMRTSSGNVGIGTNTPSQKLEVDGTIKQSGTYNVQISNGTDIVGSNQLSLRASSSYAQLRSSTNAMYLDASTGHYFRNGSGSTTHAVVTSSGNVGIGTDSPSTKFQIHYDGGHTSGTVSYTNAAIDLYNPLKANTDEKGSIITFSDNYYDGTLYHRTTRAAIKGGTDTPNNTADGFLAFYTDSSGANSATERMRIDKNGNVGIGTSSPGRDLHVIGSAIVSTKLEGTNQGHLLELVNSNASPTYNGIRFDHGTTSKMAVTHIADGTTKGYVQIGNSWDAGSEILVVDGRTSRVGIGTTSPSDKLHVSGSIRVDTGDRISMGGSGLSMFHSGTYAEIANYTGDFIIRNTAANEDIIFKAEAGTGSDVEIMRIDGSSGNVGIGTTSPYTPLDIDTTESQAFTIRRSGTQRIKSDATSSNGGFNFIGNTGNSWSIGAVGDNFTIQDASYLGDPTGYERVRIDSSGNVGIGTTSQTAKLHSMGADGSAFSLRLGRADTGSEWSFNHAGDDLRIYNQGGSGKDIVFSVDAGGTDKGNKVGIGTDVPSAKLDVVGFANIKDGNDNVMISSGNTAMTTGTDNTAVGYNALQKTTTGAYNTAFGTSALRENLISVSNSAFGYGALRENTGANNAAFGTASLYNKTSGDNNSAFGVNALYTNATGSNNVAVGRNAGYYTTGSNNALIGYYAGHGASGASTFSNAVALGYQSLYSLTTGANNTAVGMTSGFSNTDGSQNSFFGRNAGYYSTGSNNVLIGYEAGYGSATSAYSNTVAIGQQALHDLTTGDHNTAIGLSASDKITTGSYNVSLGNYALRQNQTASANTALGYGAAYETTSSNNTAVGYLSAYECQTHNAALGSRALNYSTGSYNTAVGSYAAQGVNGVSNYSNTVAVGYSALVALTTGASNTGVGYRALASNLTGGNNTAVGNIAGVNITGGNNTVMGFAAGADITAGSNTAIGWRAGEDNDADNTMVGREAGRYTTGDNNVAIGNYAAKGVETNSTFSNTVAVGYEALTALTTGGSNTAVGYQAATNITTGSYNTALGHQSMLELTTGNYNTAGGYYSMRDAYAEAGNNTAYGYNSGRYMTSGSNTAIGYEALFSNSVVSGNTGVGWRAGRDGAYYNVSVGYGAATNNTGTGNTVVGFNAALGGATSNFANTVAVGREALYSLTTGNYNTAVGYQAGYGISDAIHNTIFGHRAADSLTAEGYNTAIGSEALGNSTGAYYTTSLGYQSLFDATDNYAVGLGYKAGYNGAFGGVYAGAFSGQYCTGDNNVLVGYAAGQGSSGASNFTYTTAVGHNSLKNLTTGHSNTGIGYQAGYSLNSGIRNVMLGYQAGYYETGSDKLYIANSNTTTPLIYGEFDNDYLKVNGDLEVELTASGNFTVSDGTHDLFQVDTSTTGTLFSVNDVSGLPKLEVDEDEGVIAKSIKVDDEGLLSPGDYGKGAEIWYEGTSTPSAGFIYYLDSSGGWTAAQANAAGTATGMLAISAGTDSDVDGMVLRGFVRVSNALSGNVGDPVYLEPSASGRLTTTKPTTAGQYVRRLGYLAKGVNVIYFNPSNEFEAL